MRSIPWILVLAVAFLCGCRRTAAPADGPVVAVTTSYLESALREFLGDQVEVIRLAEPGTCPGHFDIRPSQVQALRGSRLVLRFDFQKSLDAKLEAGDGAGPRVAEVSIRGGMGRPDSYLAACRQIADHLVALHFISRPEADRRLGEVSGRLEAWASVAHQRAKEAGLAGVPVIASAHQRDFAAWLGLKVVAVFRAADTAGIGEIEEAIRAGTAAQVGLVIANLPEGRHTADALAERLQARVVVLENFPALREGRVSFDEMANANLDALLRSAATLGGGASLSGDAPSIQPAADQPFALQGERARRLRLLDRMAIGKRHLSP